MMTVQWICVKRLVKCRVQERCGYHAAMAKSLPSSALRENQSLRAGHRQYTRDRLVRAAGDVFRRHGYRAARVEDIAAAAGTSRTTFYLHFPTKADIAIEFRNRLTPDVEAILRGLGQFKDPSPADLRDWFAGAAKVWQRRRIEFDVAMEASMDLNLREANLELLARHVAIIGEALGQVLPPDSVPSRSKLLLLYLQMVYALYRWKVQGLDFDGDEMLDALTDLWWQGLFAPQLGTGSQPQSGT